MDLLLATAAASPDILGPLSVHLIVFLLAILLGFEVISKVPPRCTRR
jgi:hypothetical protein